MRRRPHFFALLAALAAACGVHPAVAQTEIPATKVKSATLGKSIEQAILDGNLGAGLPSGGSVGQVITNSAPGTGAWTSPSALAAGTAAALAADPADCSAGNLARGINAAGTAQCAAESSVAAGTAAALAADPADCTGSNFALGVNAAGTAQCAAYVAGHAVEDEGGGLTQRAALNFAGAGVTCADSGGKTICTIPGGGAGSQTPWTQAIDADGYAASDLGSLTFNYSRFGVRPVLSWPTASNQYARWGVYPGDPDDWAGVAVNATFGLTFNYNSPVTSYDSPFAPSWAQSMEGNYHYGAYTDDRSYQEWHLHAHRADSSFGVADEVGAFSVGEAVSVIDAGTQEVVATGEVVSHAGGVLRVYWYEHANRNNDPVDEDIVRGEQTSTISGETGGEILADQPLFTQGTASCAGLDHASATAQAWVRNASGTDNDDLTFIVTRGDASDFAAGNCVETFNNGANATLGTITVAHSATIETGVQAFVHQHSNPAAPYYNYYRPLTFYNIAQKQISVGALNPSAKTGEYAITWGATNEANPWPWVGLVGANQPGAGETRVAVQIGRAAREVATRLYGDLDLHDANERFATLRPGTLAATRIYTLPELGADVTLTAWPSLPAAANRLLLSSGTAGAVAASGLTYSGGALTGGTTTTFSGKGQFGSVGIDGATIDTDGGILEVTGLPLLQALGYATAPPIASVTIDVPTGWGLNANEICGANRLAGLWSIDLGVPSNGATPTVTIRGPTVDVDEGDLALAVCGDPL